MPFSKIGTPGETANFVGWDSIKISLLDSLVCLWNIFIWVVAHEGGLIWSYAFRHHWNRSSHFFKSQNPFQFSRSVASDSLRPHESQHARPLCPSPATRVYWNSCPSSWWCHPAISSSVVPFSSCPQSLPASGSFSMSQHFALGGQSIGVSASASVLPVNTQDWSPLGWTDWISLQSKGLSRVFSSTTVQSINFSALSFLHSPTLTSIHDHWKNHSLV